MFTNCKDHGDYLKKINKHDPWKNSDPDSKIKEVDYSSIHASDSTALGLHGKLLSNNLEQIGTH